MIDFNLKQMIVAAFDGAFMTLDLSSEIHLSVAEKPRRKLASDSLSPIVSLVFLTFIFALLKPKSKCY